MVLTAGRLMTGRVGPLDSGACPTPACSVAMPRRRAASAAARPTPTGCGSRATTRRTTPNPANCVAEWRPLPHHAAFDNVLNGGIIGTLLDCHANWTAAMHLMRERGLAGPPGCVTADYAIRLRRPTPVDRPVPAGLAGRRSRAIGSSSTRNSSSGGIITATCRGTFVAVGPDHPAYERW